MDFDFSILGDYSFRLVVASVAGGALGFDREMSGHWAGLRTHMVVSLASAIFVLLGAYIADGDPNAGTRVLQGVATGVGFLGAGTILKQASREEIKGLTTASSIWLAAGLGSVAGLARYELLVAGLVLAVIVLAVLKPFSDRLGPAESQKVDSDD
jgi:putative Mg2+ transporter-C (MgtC) family protein